RSHRQPTMQLWRVKAEYPDAPSVSRFYDELLQRVQKVHDVSALAVVNTRPFLGWSLGARLQVPGRAVPAEDDPIVDFRVISGGYLTALRARLMYGRGIDEHDGADAPPVALVNTTMARRFWPAGDPPGSSIRLR